MDAVSMIAMGYPVGVGLAALGAGIGLGTAVGSGLEAMGRQPEMAGKLLINMIIGAAFIEAMAIYALITPFVAHLAKVF